LENVVFRDGEAIGLLDFEFAAPGRPLYDVAMTLRLCGPVRDPSNLTEFKELDGISRLAAFCDAYGVRSRDADELIDALVAGCRAGGRFVEGRARSGQEPFKRLWMTQGAARFERDEKWILQRASEITDALR
jgi:Ser/Thr protein kinase RdoA (MazF antagonist)